MIDKVVSGGQTGADQAGWRAAKAVGIPTGGFMPKGWITEDGPRPEFAALYCASEFATRNYPARTERNVAGSDVTLWFGDATSAGGKQTSLACAKHMRHFFDVSGMTPTQVAFQFGTHDGEWNIVNVAGNRESKHPGIGERTERFLLAVFRILGHRPPPVPTFIHRRDDPWSNRQ